MKPIFIFLQNSKQGVYFPYHCLANISMFNIFFHTLTVMLLNFLYKSSWGQDNYRVYTQHQVINYVQFVKYHDLSSF